MRCAACGAEMRLMQVIVGDPLRWAPSIERQIFKCPTCPHVAKRLVFGALPISANVATTHPDEPAIKVRAQPSAEPRLTATLNGRQPAEIAAAARNSTWSRAVEKLRRRQAALKEAAAAPNLRRSREVPRDRAKPQAPYLTLGNEALIGPRLPQL
jgi:hypothetical protein